MSNLNPEYVEPEETGLNLFDDRASAAGSFPHAMLGYDKSAVDTYVRELEARISSLTQLTRHQQREVSFVQREAGTTNFTKLGAHIKALLGAAEAQADDLTNQAVVEGNRITAEANRIAADVRKAAEDEADDVRIAALADARTLREKQAADGQAGLAAATAEAEAIRAAASQDARALVEEAQRNAAAVISAANVEASRIAQAAERDATATRLAASSKAEQQLAAASSDAQAASTRMADLLTQAKAQLDEILKQGADESARAAGVRAASVAEAETIRQDAIRAAEEHLANARKEATASRAALEAEIFDRKETLAREIALLERRRTAVVHQLQNMRELATQAGVDFPEAGS